MKASTQYNDYVGTAAADMSDYTKLEDYLKAKGLNTDRYKPIGVELYCGYSSFIHLTFLCKDTESGNNTIMKFAFEKEITIEEFLNLFKRFNVLLTWAKGVDYSNWELDSDTQCIDDRN